MTVPVLVTGDDLSLPVTLKKNGNTFLIDPAATVTAMLVTTDRSSGLTIEVVQDSDTTGADWANSLVVINLPSTFTVGIDVQGMAVLEIQVDDGGKRTWFVTVNIVRGLIS